MFMKHVGLLVLVIAVRLRPCMLPVMQDEPTCSINTAILSLHM